MWGSHASAQTSAQSPASRPRRRPAVQIGSQAMRSPSFPRRAMESHSTHSTEPFWSASSTCSAVLSCVSVGQASPSKLFSPSNISAKLRAPSKSTSSSRKSSRQTARSSSSESESAKAQASSTRRCSTPMCGSFSNSSTAFGACEARSRLLRRVESWLRRCPNSPARPSHLCCNACTQVKRWTSSMTKRCSTRSLTSAEALFQLLRCWSKVPWQIRLTVSACLFPCVRKGLDPVMSM
mmetsp:Transcript_85931/g.199771  ORF Transcript_85931/g.199771 Transcript_85931/m.199771 type:complete len:237 (+) Transcript_85931:168-878(+)